MTRPHRVSARPKLNPFLPAQCVNLLITDGQTLLGNNALRRMLEIAGVEEEGGSRENQSDKWVKR